MFRPWAFWRRLQYITGFLVILIATGTTIYYTLWHKDPTCFDGVQNGEETGIDCGGACTRICAPDILMPQPLWAQSFKIVDGQYNAVAYIENRNRSVGTQELGYTFKIYDDTGLITERSGVTVLPPDGVYPVFEGRITTGTRVPTRTTVEFTNEIVWLPASIGREQFVLEERDLAGADSKPRLIAQMRNTALTETKNVEIIATIFDAHGNPLTASRTEVDYFGGRTTENIVFTWPEPIAKTLRSCEVPTDVVLAIDLSGSMNDDGGTPPEPISSVLKAAQSFISRLHDRDQSSIVTYATDATLVEKLSNENVRIESVVSQLSIAPKEERGSTNTGDAFKLMAEEISSPRHNKDARKVAILFTDGLTNAPGKTPEEYAIEHATVLKNLGVDVFTIGLGAKVNETFLRELATDAEHAFIAPSIHEVDEVYQTITSAICEDGAAVIEIIPKPETSFVGQ